MKIVIIGATGDTGREVVMQALAAGHDVTAVARTPAVVQIHHERLHVVQGDVMQPGSLTTAMTDCEAVLSALGIRGFRNNLKPTTLYSQGTTHIMQTMHAQNVRRFVGVTSEGVAHYPSKPLLYRWVVKPLLQHSYADMARLEAAVKASGLDWTIIRPSGLTNNACTETYRTALNTQLKNPKRISRADVAHFMLKTLTDDHYIGAVVDVAG